eukprot:gb/GECG01004167.1/.p1 GENE.gb/GECG01004167.1/~~gb/GECG01004167.1/.p1  ORF type:complete len:799 (+),score=136.18 gb/GECG01004167.1/:1-2397(+)
MASPSDDRPKTKPAEEEKGFLSTLIPWLESLDPGFFTEPLDIEVLLDADFVSNRLTSRGEPVDEDLREELYGASKPVNSVSLSSARGTGEAGAAAEEQLEDDGDENTADKVTTPASLGTQWERRVLNSGYVSELEQILTNGDSARGVVRVNPRSRAVWHGVISLTLESYLVHFDPAGVRPLLRKQIRIANPGYIEEPVELPFDFSVYVGLEDGNLMESFEGTYSAIRHSLLLHVERPWYTLDIEKEVPFQVQVCFEEPSPQPVVDLVTETVTKRDLRDSEEYADVENKDELIAQLENDDDEMEVEYEVLLEAEQAHAIQRQYVDTVATEELKKTSRGPIMTIPTTGAICMLDFKKDTFPLTGKLEGEISFKYVVHPIVRVELRLVREERGAEVEARPTVVFSQCVLDVSKYTSRKASAQVSPTSGRGKNFFEDGNSTFTPIYDRGTVEFQLNLSHLHSLFPTIIGVSSRRNAKQKRRSSGNTAASGGAAAPEVGEGGLEDVELSDHGASSEEDEFPHSGVQHSAPKMVENFVSNKGTKERPSKQQDVGEVQDLLSDTDVVDQGADDVHSSDSAPHFAMKRPTSVRYFLELEFSTNDENFHVPLEFYNGAFETVARAIAQQELAREGHETPSEDEISEAVKRESVQEETRNTMDRIPKGIFSNRHEIFLYRDMVQGWYSSTSAAERIERAMELEKEKQNQNDGRPDSDYDDDYTPEQQARGVLKRSSSFGDDGDEEDEAADLQEAAGVKMRGPTSAVDTDVLPRPHSSNSPSSKARSNEGFSSSPSSGSPLKSSSRPTT